jgi:diacylglycerol kinase (ATP)
MRQWALLLLMVGIGLDGKVTRKVEKRLLKRLGVIGYLLAILWYGLTYRGFLASVISGERAEQIPALQIVIGNTQLYAGAIKFTWRARGDDGLLDVCILKKQSMLGHLIMAIEFFLRRKERTKWISYQRGEAIEI